MLRYLALTMSFSVWVLGSVSPAAEQGGAAQAASPTAEIRRLTVQPTPLLVARDQGPRRIVDVTVELSRPATDLVLRVKAGNEDFELPVAPAATSRTAAQEVEVPNTSEPFECQVTATVAGQSQSTSVTVKPQRKWRVYIAASSHTDIGYTHLQPECAERHNLNLDLAAQLCERHPEFKWNCEVAWQVENYLATRSSEQVDQFVRLARDGRLGVQALYVNILTGLCSHEEYCRMAAYAYGLHRRFGIPHSSAMINDVPTCVASTPMVLAQSGIRYFSNGINITRAYTFDRMYDQSPCWWEGPDGSRVLMMFVPSIAYALRMGFHDSFQTARQRTLKHLAEYEARENYPYDAVFFNGASNDNCPVEPKMAEIAAQWNRRYAWPKIILSHNAEFFQYIEQHYGERLPVVRGSGGTYWEDGAGSSARETSRCRNAREKLDQADRLLALASWLRPEMAYPRQALDDAWRNCLLYDEHTWGANTAGTQPESEFTKAQWAIKARFAEDAHRQSTALLDRGTQALASLVRTEGDSLVVLNTASWPRTEVVEMLLPEGQAIVEPSVSSCRVGPTTLAVVRDVPACGYRVLRCGAQGSSPAGKDEGRVATDLPPQEAVIESRFYRARFDPATGAIVTLVDKESGRDLVDQQGPYRLNQYLYVSGGKDSRIINLKQHPAAPELTIATPQQARLRRVSLGPLGQRMIVETSTAMTPKLVSEITVWEDVKRVDVVNRLTKTLTYDKEAAYFAFPLAVRNPVLRYEEPAAIVRPDQDFLPGAGLEWLTVQHFVELAADDTAICWSTPDAPLVCFQDINRGQWPAEYSAANGHLYAYVMNNYWYTNYLAGQGGEFTFRFALTSRPQANNVASARFGWSAANPLQVVSVGANSGGPLPPGSASLLQIAEPNVLLIGMKRAEAGNALVLRLWEVAGQATTAHVQLPLIPFKTAHACSLVEEPQEALETSQSAVAVPMRRSGLATLLLE